MVIILRNIDCINNKFESSELVYLFVVKKLDLREDHEAYGEI